MKLVSKVYVLSLFLMFFNANAGTSEVSKAQEALALLYDKGFITEVSGSVDNPTGWPVTKIKPLADNKDSLSTHLLMIAPTKEGAEIFFKNYHYGKKLKCPKNGMVFDFVISIEDQPIQASYLCSKQNTSDGIVEIFSLNTKAGNEFLINASRELEFISVRFKSYSIPFDVRGISERWNSMNIPAI